MSKMMACKMFNLSPEHPRNARPQDDQAQELHQKTDKRRQFSCPKQTALPPSNGACTRTRQDSHAKSGTLRERGSLEGISQRKVVSSKQRVALPKEKICLSWELHFHKTILLRESNSSIRTNRHRWKNTGPFKTRLQDREECESISKIFGKTQRDLPLAPQDGNKSTKVKLGQNSSQKNHRAPSTWNRNVRQKLLVRIIERNVQKRNSSKQEGKLKHFHLSGTQLPRTTGSRRSLRQTYELFTELLKRDGYQKKTKHNPHRWSTNSKQINKSLKMNNAFWTRKRDRESNVDRSPI